MADINCNIDPDNGEHTQEDIRIMQQVVSMQQRGLQFYVIGDFKSIKVVPQELLTKEDVAFMDKSFRRILVMLAETALDFFTNTTHEMHVVSIEDMDKRRH